MTEEKKEQQGFSEAQPIDLADIPSAGALKGRKFSKAFEAALDAVEAMDDETKPH